MTVLSKCFIIVDVRTGHPVKKGSEEMKMPSAAELLVQMTREAEQRRILELANECKDLEELKAKLKELLSK